MPFKLINNGRHKEFFKDISNRRKWNCHRSITGFIDLSIWQLQWQTKEHTCDNAFDNKEQQIKIKTLCIFYFYEQNFFLALFFISIVLKYRIIYVSHFFFNFILYSIFMHSFLSWILFAFWRLYVKCFGGKDVEKKYVGLLFN